MDGDKVRNSSLLKQVHDSIASIQRSAEYNIPSEKKFPDVERYTHYRERNGMDGWPKSVRSAYTAVIAAEKKLLEVAETERIKFESEQEPVRKARSQAYKKIADRCEDARLEACRLCDSKELAGRFQNLLATLRTDLKVK